MTTTSAQRYETDFYGWTQEQAAVLRSGNFAGLDLDNLIEEIESMGKSERRELASRLEVLLKHLLKWKFQPEKRSTSWAVTIENQRDRLAEHLAENPSLKPKISEAQLSAYRYAVRNAAEETEIRRDVFPAQCPWSFEQVMNPDFWPEKSDID